MLDLKDIISIWGAVTGTGTAGTLVAIYAWRLNKRSLTPRIAMTDVIGKIRRYSDGDAFLHFTCTIFSRSNVTTTVERFDLDLGHKLNAACTTMRPDSHSDKLRLSHCTDPGMPGDPFGRREVSHGNWDKPIILQPNAVVSPVTLEARVYVSDANDSSTIHLFADALERHRFSVSVCIYNGRRVVYRGRKVRITYTDA